MSIINNKRVAGMDELGPLIVESLKYQSDVRLTVKGNSMYPLFRSMVDSVRLTNVDKVKKYDIVLYRRDSGQYVLHRVLKCEADRVGIAGDNEEELEYPIMKTQILAVVSGFWRKEKYCSCKNVFYRMYSIIWAMVFKRRRKTVRILKKIKRKLV